MAHTTLTPGLLEYIATRFKALGDPARLRVLDSLRRGPRTVTQLVRDTHLEAANVSRHLTVLQRLGLVNRRRDQAFVYFSVADSRLYALCDLLCDQLETESLARGQVVA